MGQELAMSLISYKWYFIFHFLTICFFHGECPCHSEQNLTC